MLFMLAANSQQIETVLMVQGCLCGKLILGDQTRLPVATIALQRMVYLVKAALGVP
ncbi:hypothetical protein QNH14_06425 [Apirhabdus apintestini]|nr:hypothetical protein QNH14_06425 [Enterobacteriaceae bacterium CA-0114]